MTLPLNDITSIANLVSLEHLWLKNTKVTNILPISKLSKWEWLYILDNQIVDISLLENNTNLSKLYILEENLNSGVGALASLSSINTLIFYNGTPLDCNELEQLSQAIGEGKVFYVNCTYYF